MSKLTLFSYASCFVLLAWGTPCNEASVSSTTTTGTTSTTVTTTTSSDDDCGCTVYTPPALVVPEHNLDITHSWSVTHNLDITHTSFTPPAIDSLLCDCAEDSTIATNEEVAEEEAKGLCDDTQTSSTAAFAAAQTLAGSVYDAQGTLIGRVELKVGRMNKSARTLKISGKIIKPNGKKLSASSVTVVVGSNNAFSCTLAFGGEVGNVAVKVAGVDAKFTAAVSSAGCTLTDCAVGGELEDGEMVFSYKGKTTPTLPTGFVFLLSESSWKMTATVSQGTKITFAKASSPKVVSTSRSSKVTLNAKTIISKLVTSILRKFTIINFFFDLFKVGTSTNSSDKYAVTGLDGENVRALKLRYTKKTGTLKGSYQIHILKYNGTKKPKLKKLSMSVSGFVFDGVGTGVVYTSAGVKTGEFSFK